VESSKELFVAFLNYAIEVEFSAKFLMVDMGEVISFPRSGANTTLIINFGWLEFEVFVLFAKF